MNVGTDLEHFEERDGKRNMVHLFVLPNVGAASRHDDNETRRGSSYHIRLNLT